MRTQDQKMHSVILTNSQLVDGQNSLSDFLCWVSGYNAGCEKGDVRGYPFDIEAIRALNIELKGHAFLPTTQNGD